jgi:hypothetical protein
MREMKTRAVSFVAEAHDLRQVASERGRQDMMTRLASRECTERERGGDPFQNLKIIQQSSSKRG